MATIPTKNNDNIDLQSTKPDAAHLSWKADSFVRYARGLDWHIGVLFFGVAALSLMIILRDQLLISVWLMVPVVVMAIVVLILRGVAKPHRLKYSLADDGVMVDDHLMPFSHFRAFSINEFDNHVMLRLWPNGRLHFPISVLLSEIDLENVRDFIKNLLPEQEDSANLSDQISHFFRL